MKYSADLYAIDGLLAFQRAKVMGGIIRSLNKQQKESLSNLKFGDSRTWPDMPDQFDKRSMSHTVNVAVMTYASGEGFRYTLTAAQRKLITDVVEIQRQYLNEIVSIRRTIATELRLFLKGEYADKDKVLSLSKRYGELDGEMSYLYATAFADISKTLTVKQKNKLAAMRPSDPAAHRGPFLYSSPIKMPKLENMDFLFGLQRSGS